MLGKIFVILVQCAIKLYLCHSLINLYAEISSGAWCQFFCLNHYLIPNFMFMRKLGRMCQWAGSTEPSLLAYALTLLMPIFFALIICMLIESAEFISEYFYRESKQSGLGP